MSGQRVRKRVEEEARAEEAWSLEDYEWDPFTCVARKKRVLAPGEPRAAFSAAIGALQQVAAEGITQAHAAAENPRLARLPVLETVDRADAEPATVCEVIGCGSSLEGLKRYYVRMRVCERHLHAPAIVVNGVVSRFCQQCAKFQFVGEFSGNKKSCAATLERHNARHRAKVLARMQDLADADSDAAPARSGRSKAKPKAAAASAAMHKPTQRPAAAAAAAAAVAAARTAAERASSDTSGAGQPDWLSPRLPENPHLAFPVLPLAGQPTTGPQQQFAAALGGGGAMWPWQGQARAAVPPPGAQALSAGAPGLPAEATAPCKPASPHLALDAWDGGSSGFLEGPPRPLVTTGGNGVVSTGDRATSAAPAAGVTAAAAYVRPQEQHLAHSPSMPSTWPLQPLPHDVRSGLNAVQGQLLDMPRGVAQAVGGMAYPGSYAVPGAWQPACDSLPVGPAPPHRQGAVSGGSTPSVCNALGASGSDLLAAKASQATAGQAVQATGVVGTLADGGALAGGAARVYGCDGLPIAGTTKSGGSFQSEAEPCGSSGRVATNVAASPLYSQDEEGVSATRVSASGAGMGGADGGTDASARLQPGDVAARISCIMQELCPLIEQFKQGVTHGSSHGLYDGTALGAGAAPVGQTRDGDDAGTLTSAAAASSPPLRAAGVGGQAARDREGSRSLPPLMDTAMAMMQTASQLAASLQQARSTPAGANAPPPPQQQQQHVWTVTSGGPEVLSQPLDSAGLKSLRWQRSDFARSSSQQPPLMPHSLQPPREPYNPPGWRSLASHPGVAINEAAAQRAASIPMPTGPVPSAPLAPSAGHAGPGLVVSVPSISTTTAAAMTTSQQVSRGGGGSGGGFSVGNGAWGPQQGYGAPQLQLPGDGAGVPSVAGGVGGDVDSDDDMFQQLLTILQDDAAGEDIMAVTSLQQQQQQQLFHGIASAAQHAVTAHQHVVHSMPYGNVPATPFYWPAQAAAGMAPADSALPSIAPAIPHLPHPHPHSQAPQPQYTQAHPPAIQSPLGWPNPAAAPGGAPAALFLEEPDDVEPRELTRVSLKAMNVLPHELPSNLRSNLRRWLKEARAEALQATLRPGCLQLVVDVLRSPSAAEMCSVLVPANDADQAAADVFRLLGQRLRDTYVQVDRRVLQMRVGERPVVLSWEDAAHDGGLDGAKYPTLCGCSAAAVCAGSDALLQLSGSHLSHPATKVFARIRGRDLQAALLPPDAPAGGEGPPAAAAADGGLRLTVAVPPGSSGLMAVEVGVGHLLGDWWPVLVLPPGCEGAAAELRRLRADAEAATAAAAAGGAFRRLLLDLASVLEVFTDAAAADASAAAAADAAAAAAAAAARTQSSSSGGGAAADAAGPSGARGAGGAATASALSAVDSPSSPGAPSEGRCPSPSGDTYTHVSRSDASFTAVSAGSWSCAGRTDTLTSSHVGSTLGSFMTTASALASPSMGMAAGQAHSQALAAQHAQHVTAATAGGTPAAAAGDGGSAASAAAAIPQIALLPLPPSAALRQGLSRTARLLRFAVGRGLPHLTALMLAAANCLARTPDGNRQLPQPSTQPSLPAAQAQAAPRSSLAHLLAAAGVDPQALLPLAVLSGSAATVDLLAAFAARVLGSPLRLDQPQGPGGLSALHLASLLPDDGALACHIISTQPWAAWEWLSLGWTPPASLLAAASPGTGAAAADPGAAAITTAGQVADGKEDGNGAEVAEAGEGEDQEVVLRPAPPVPPRLTPGQLSVLLGANSAVSRAVGVLVTAQRGGGDAGSAEGPLASAGSAAPAPAALVAAVEAWGRTGVALLEALCAQLAAQRI